MFYLLLYAHFGLSKRLKVDSLIITWPGGHIQKKFDIESNQTIVITENYNKTETYSFPIYVYYFNHSYFLVLNKKQ